MDSQESALQVILAVAKRIQLPRKSKFLALAVFTDRYEIANEIARVPSSVDILG